MGSTFWSNTVWYLILGAAAAAALISALVRAPDKKRVITLFFIISGFTLGLEVINFCILKAYEYYPELIPKSRIDDARAGNLFSQLSIVAAGLFLAVYKLRFSWYLVFALVFCAIELLFLRLGIYTQNWYRTWLTFLGTLAMFWLTNKAYTGTVAFRSKPRRSISLVLGLYTLQMETAFWVSIITGLITVNTTILPDRILSYITVCLLNFFTMLAGAWFMYFTKTDRLRKGAAAALLYVLVFAADQAGLFHIKEGLYLLFSSLDIWGMYFYMRLLHHLISRNISPEAGTETENTA